MKKHKKTKAAKKAAKKTGMMMQPPPGMGKMMREKMGVNHSKH